MPSYGSHPGSGPSSTPPCSTPRYETSRSANGVTADSNPKAQHDPLPSRNSPSMIGTRVLVGSLLALAAVGVLIGDGYLAPWFPCLFACMMAAGVLASRQLVRLFPLSYRPSRILVTTGVLLCLATNWYPVARKELGFAPAVMGHWPFLMFIFIAILVVAFLLEMYRYREPGSAVPRLGVTVLA